MIWASGATGLARLSDTQEVLSSSLRTPTKVKFAAVLYAQVKRKNGA